MNYRNDDKKQTSSETNPMKLIKTPVPPTKEVRDDGNKKTTRGGVTYGNG